MTVDRGQKEKRDFIRMKIDTPLKAEIRADGLTTRGLCHELSGGGMLLSTEQSLAIGTELEVTIASEHGHIPTLRAKALVIRCEQQGSRHQVGLEILEILH